MNPFAALNLTATIVQFVEPTSKFESESRQMYSSLDGPAVKHLEPEVTAKHLTWLTDYLATSYSPSSRGHLCLTPMNV